MNRDPLREALRSLPKERARADFTPRLLARLETDRRRDRDLPAIRRPTWRAVAAATALAGAMAIGGVAISRFAARPDAAAHTAVAPQPEARRARLERLEAERARLSAELQELKRMADTADPVIYLGGDDRVDLVLDVGRLARRHQAGVEPAAYRRPDTP